MTDGSPLVLQGSVLHLTEELVQSTSCDRRHAHHLQESGACLLAHQRQQAAASVARAYPQAGVELVQHQAHGARQVAHVRALLVQGVLEDLEVLHPLHGEAVVDDIRLRRQLRSGAGLSGQRADGERAHLVHDHDERKLGLVEDAEGGRGGGVRLLPTGSPVLAADWTHLQAYSMLDMKVTGLTLRDVSIT